jgi:hypothetical protein
MGSASNYWQLVWLDGTGQRQVEEVSSAKTFFQERFVAEPPISDVLLQRDLQLLRKSTSSAERQQAEWCLRCFISQQIEQVCMRLEIKFGTQHGFTHDDLLPFVLNDKLRADQPLPNRLVSTTQYRSLVSEILQTFDAHRAGLSTWVTRQVRHHPELRRFLQEHGVYLATDWGILNDTSPELLQTVFTEFYVLSAAEVASAYHLLQAYHQVYRQDRLRQRQLGQLQARAVCSAPSSEQLTRIDRYLQAQALSPPLSPEHILAKLQAIASQLRQYRLHRSNKTLPTEPLDQPDAPKIADKLATTDPEMDSEEDSFLMFYRKQMLLCLDCSLAKVTCDRVVALQQRKKKEEAQQFLIALKLVHCEGQPMGKIAPQIGLEAQYQVSRLLELRQFRANVGSHLLELLLSSVLEQAEVYADPTRLHKLKQQIETILEEQIDSLIHAAESEASVGKQHPPTSLFARRLCHYLDSRKNTL